MLVADLHPQPSGVARRLFSAGAARLAGRHISGDAETDQGIEDVVRSCAARAATEQFIDPVNRGRQEANTRLEASARPLRGEDRIRQSSPGQLGMDLPDPVLQARRHRRVHLQNLRHDAPQRHRRSLPARSSVQCLKRRRRRGGERQARRSRKHAVPARPSQHVLRFDVTAARRRPVGEPDRHVDHDDVAGRRHRQHIVERPADEELGSPITRPAPRARHQPATATSIHAGNHRASSLGARDPGLSPRAGSRNSARRCR